MVVEMCGPLENGTVLRDFVVLAILLSCLLALHHPRLPRSLLGRWFHWRHGHMYSTDNIEPQLTGVVMGYLLASDSAAALPCKHHENGSENATKVCVFS